jgi:glutamate--cysteine ligase
LSKLIYEYYSPKGLKKSKNITNSSRLVIKEAEKFGIKWSIEPGTQIVTLTYKGQEQSYYHQVPSSTTALAKYACNHKKVTSNLLRQAGVCVPHGYRVRRDQNQDYFLEVFSSLSKPLVVKPTNGYWGENITVGIIDEKEYLDAIELAFSYSVKKNTGAIVEEMFPGQEYRILLTREKVIGVLKRIPANVIGNGQDSISKLVKQKNKEEIRGVKGGEKSHLKIRIDKKMKAFLNEQRLSIGSILPPGEKIFLRRVSNISQGGEAIDFTDKVHPSVREIALKAIGSIPGLSFAGVDFMSLDITKKQSDNSYVIIEINDSPGFDIHDYPYEGENRHTAREFLFLLFPDLKK